MRIASIICLLIFLFVAAALAQEPAREETPPDSLAADTLLFAPDSLAPAQHTGVLRAWLLPVAVISATTVAFILLFTTRSK